MDGMSVTLSIVYTFLKVIGVFTLLIGGIYGFVIPTFFPTYKTYLILWVGVGSSALIGGYIAYHYTLTATTSVKYFSIVFSAVLVAVCVTYFSLWLILNVRGT